MLLFLVNYMLLALVEWFLVINNVKKHDIHIKLKSNKLELLGELVI